MTGLLFAWKIKAGPRERNTCRDTLQLHPLVLDKSYRSHILKRKKTVLVKFLPADNPLVQQMFKEHAQIRDLIISI